MTTPDIFTVLTEDGWTLEIEEHSPTDGLEPVGAVLLTHAMMVDRRTYTRRGRGLAHFMADRGWRVFVADFRGRHHSGRVPEAGAQWTYDELVRYDVPAMVKAVRTRIEGTRLVYVGHSLGGHTGLAAAGAGFFETPPEAYVCLSANIWRPSLEPSALRRLKKRCQFWLFVQTARLVGYFPARNIGLGSCNEAGDYAVDLYRAWADDWWGNRDGSLDYTAALSRVREPVLSVVGRGDRLMAHPVGAQAWFSAVGAADAEFWIAEKGRFGLSFDPDHMNLVTSTASRPLWGVIEEWMHRALQNSPE